MNVKETLKGRDRVEIGLVRLLKKQRCWADVIEISEALWRVGHIADSLEEEATLSAPGAEGLRNINSGIQVDQKPNQ